jgi:uncharacterized membrane protein YfcA
VRRLLLYAIVGLFAQLVDGALGMAYGVTATSLMLSGGTSPAVASASVHLAEVGTTLVSGVSHWRFGNVSWRTVRWIAIPGALGAFFGATVLSNLTADWVKPVIAALLLTLGIYILGRFAFGFVPDHVAEHHMKRRFLIPLGLGGGFLDAIGGGGWGPVTTPTLMTAGKMEPRTAVGTASASEFLVSVFASVGFLTALGSQGVDFEIAGALLVGGAIAAPLAAWAVHHLPARITGTIVGSLLVVTNVRTILIAAEVPGTERFVGLLLSGALCVPLLVRVIRIVREERRFEAARAALALEEPPVRVGEDEPS